MDPCKVASEKEKDSNLLKDLHLPRPETFQPPPPAIPDKNCLDSGALSASSTNPKTLQINITPYPFSPTPNSSTAPTQTTLETTNTQNPSPQRNTTPQRRITKATTPGSQTLSPPNIIRPTPCPIQTLQLLPPGPILKPLIQQNSTPPYLRLISNLTNGFLSMAERQALTNEPMTQHFRRALNRPSPSSSTTGPQQDQMHPEPSLQSHLFNPQ